MLTKLGLESKVNIDYLVKVAESLPEGSRAYNDLIYAIEVLGRLAPTFEKFEALGAAITAYDESSAAAAVRNSFDSPSIEGSPLVFPATGSPALDSLALSAMVPDEVDQDYEDLV
jgi:hypothetical protein